MSLNVFFRYFGSKWRSAVRYPPPRHETIVEPFAGSAGYATRYHWKRVILVEKDPLIASIWRFLLRASAREILALPDLPADGVAMDLDVCEEARQLIRFNLNGASGNRDSFTRWSIDDPASVWGRTIRARLASQVDKIRHWQIIEGTHADAPDVEATWFVDPPYQRLGNCYPCGADDLDFAALASWCRSRRGQVIVCENEGADWLPFRFLGNVAAAHRGTGRELDGISREAIWTNDTEAPSTEMR